MAALSSDDVNRLILGSSGRGHTGARNRALVAAFAGAGLGVAEALALQRDDVDHAAGEIRVEGTRARVVVLDAVAMEALRNWTAERRALGLGAGPLFCTRDGTALEASYIRRLMARLGREAGIVAPVNARALRESYAVARLAAGASAEELSAELGHSSVATTQRFVRQLTGSGPDGPGGPPPEFTAALLEIAHCGLAILRAERDEDGRICDFVFEYVNSAAVALLGGSAGELPGRSVRASHPHAATDGTYALWTELIETQSLADNPRLRESTGRARSVRVRRAPFGDRILMSVENMAQVTPGGLPNLSLLEPARRAS